MNISDLSDHPRRNKTILAHRPCGGIVLVQNGLRVELSTSETRRLIAAILGPTTAAPQYTATSPAKARLVSYPVHQQTTVDSAAETLS